jgi:hypothetical protein
MRTRTKVIIGVVGLAIVWSTIDDAKSSRKASSSRYTAADSARASDLVRSADSMLELLKAAGAIRKVEVIPGTAVAHVTVGPAFYAMSFEDKETAIGSVLVHATRGFGDGAVHVHDWQTNKEVGSYQPWSGFKMK